MIELRYLDRLRDEAFDAIATFTQSQQDFDPDMDAHDNATACLDAYGDARQALGERIGREAEPACAGCGSGSLANPTRAELEQRVEEAYAAVLQAAQDYRDAAAHWGNSLRKEHHGRVLDYGAACHALGEHIGREKGYGRGWNEACDEHDVIDGEVRESRLRARAEQAEARVRLYEAADYEALATNAQFVALRDAADALYQALAVICEETDDGAAHALALKTLRAYDEAIRKVPS